MTQRASPGKKAAGKPEKKKLTPTAELKRQLKIEQALYEIADAASAVTDLSSFYKRLHEIVGTLMYAGNFFIATYDEQTGLISWPYQVDEVEPPHSPVPLADFHGFTSWVIRTGRVVRHGWDLSNELLASGEIDFPDLGTANEDGIGVPLKEEGNTIGVVMVQSHTKGVEYTDQDEQVLEFVAQHIAVALSRARAMEETRQRNAELELINSVQTALAAHLDLHGIYEVVGEKLREIFNYQDVVIYSANLKTHLMTLEYGFEKGRKYERLAVPMNSLYEFFVATDKYLVFNGDFPQFAAQFKDYHVPAGELPKSALAVPVPRKREADLAVLLALEDVDGRRIFSESDVRLLQTLANSMSVALENARLFDETQQRNAELAILNSVGEAMAKTLDVRTVTKIVGDKVRDIFGADQMGILLFEQQTSLIRLLYGYDKAHDKYLDDTGIKPLPLGKGLTSKVIELRQPLLLSTREEQDGFGHYMPPELVGQIKMSESWLGLPIMVDEDVLGAVFVEDYRPHAYNENHLHLLQTLSSNMGVAIQNARLFDETEQRAAELAVINSVQEGLASKLDFDSIIELVGNKILEIFHADVIGIGIYDTAGDRLLFPYVFDHGQRFYPAPLADPKIILRFADLSAPRIIHTNHELQQVTEEWEISNIGGPMVDHSHILLSIRSGNHFMGTISIAKQPENAFNDADARLIQTLANSMSVALDNARLWEQEKMYRKALERELEIGREIQAGFLPEELPVITGWEIAASLMSAREVAGDFYDAFELPDGNIGIVIADVCDKGVGAALFMTLFRSLIRAVSNLDYFENVQVPSPHSAAERLQRAVLLTNNYIAETHGKSGMFATVFFGILDPGTGRLIYINGGHERPFILRSGNVHETLRKTGPAVGVITNPCFEIAEVQLQVGDVFLAFTDGVPDCQSPRGEFFGRDRLLVVFQNEKGSAHQLVKAIETELHQYISGGTQFDDITLLAVKRG
jgi:serine phosphatase RsbU (regulator of sigma subunit)